MSLAKLASPCQNVNSADRMADEDDSKGQQRERQREAGRIRMANLSPTQRKALARMGGRARASMGGLQPFKWDSEKAKSMAQKSAEVRQRNREERRRTMSLDEQYSRRWYAEHRQYAAEYEAVGDALDWLFGPGPGQSVVDVGCGIGLVLSRMRRLGWEGIGLDGSWNARAEAGGEPIYHVDLRDPPQPAFNHELVVCLEVAEHLEADFADTLVCRLVGYLAPGGAVVFTAAPPGQPGNGHVNCQPPSYWLEKFGALDVVRDERSTAVLRGALEIACPRMHWLPRNVMVLEKHRNA